MRLAELMQILLRIDLDAVIRAAKPRANGRLEHIGDQVRFRSSRHEELDARAIRTVYGTGRPMGKHSRISPTALVLVALRGALRSLVLCHWSYLRSSVFIGGDFRRPRNSPRKLFGPLTNGLPRSKKRSGR